MAKKEQIFRKRRDLSLLKQTAEQVAAAAAITDADVLRAGVEWTAVAPVEFRTLLESAEDDGADGQ